MINYSLIICPMSPEAAELIEAVQLAGEGEGGTNAGGHLAPALQCHVPQSEQEAERDKRRQLGHHAW